MKFGNFSPEHTKVSGLGLLLDPKSKMYDLKIYKGVMCYDNEEWHKIWKGIDLSVQN